jgi:hypothetical protein
MWKDRKEGTYREKNTARSTGRRIEIKTEYAIFLFNHSSTDEDSRLCQGDAIF